MNKARLRDSIELHQTPQIVEIFFVFGKKVDLREGFVSKFFADLKNVLGPAVPGLSALIGDPMIEKCDTHGGHGTESNPKVFSPNGGYSEELKAESEKNIETHRSKKRVRNSKNERARVWGRSVAARGADQNNQQEVEEEKCCEFRAVFFSEHERANHAQNSECTDNRVHMRSEYPVRSDLRIQELKKTDWDRFQNVTDFFGRRVIDFVADRRVRDLNVERVR